MRYGPTRMDPGDRGKAGNSMGKEQGKLFDNEPEPWEVDDQAEQCVAAVVFAEPPFGPYDYQVPDALRAAAQAGVRVQVPLGRGNRRRTGYCTAVTNCQTPSRRLKSISTVLDERVLLTPAMLRVTQWMADHYLCPLGQVLDAVVPSDVRLQAGTRRQIFLRVSAAIADQLDTLDLPPKQRKALQILAAHAEGMTQLELARNTGCTIAPIQALRKKRLVVAQARRVQQKEHTLAPTPRQPALTMNPDQKAALESILRPVREGRHETLLVHGVTGSGKTEVYIQAIEQVVQYGRQAIVLVPEISLTPQTRRRFRSRFDRVAVLHSHLSPPERHWHWQQIAAGQIQVVVGARSAVFAPTPHLGLIVLDEEHDGSFKQDIAPRYHARDVALRRARLENIPLVLGSATPSLESYHAARQGEFHLLDMPRRVADLPLPDVATIDLRSQPHGGYGGAISLPLYRAVRAAIDSGGQVILLLNRRGYSTTIQCRACGYVVTCPHCDIAMTHHRDGERTVCHYCDYEIRTPACCPECGFEGIHFGGLGTERLEKEVRARFADVACLRMDSDSMQRHGSHEEALDRFRSGEIKILLGTQMIAKGLDFPAVTLVGVINADTALHFPNFRAAEHTFQLVTQVAGRTGRGTRGGRVLVQTRSPDHPAIRAAQRHDYQMFAAQELPIRQQFHYPPSAKMIRLVIRGPVETQAEAFADYLADRIRGTADWEKAPIRLLGPAECPIPKLRGRFRFHLVLQATNAERMHDIVRTATHDVDAPADVQWIIDVDPLDML